MTIYEKVKEYLIRQPLARERTNKNRAIGNLIVRTEYEIIMDKAKMGEMVGEILSADRAWRKCLEENPDLRGKDYGKKDELEELKQQELGYNV